MRTLAAAGLAAAGVGAWLSSPVLTHGSDATVTRDSTPRVAVTIDRPLFISQRHVRVHVDGASVPRRDVQLLDSSSRVVAELPILRDGTHHVEIRIARAGLLQRTITRSFTVHVDTTAPHARFSPATVAATKPADDPYVPAGTRAVTAQPFNVSVRAERGAHITVTSDAAGAKKTTFDAASSRLRSAFVTLPQGAQTLTVRVSDAAGNTTNLTQRVIVDTRGPRIVLPAAARIGSRTLDLRLTLADPHGAAPTVHVDATKLDDSLQQLSGESPSATSTPSTTSTSERKLPLRSAYMIRMRDNGGVSEGRHVIRVDAVDALGTSSHVRRVVLVDSTEQLAAAAGEGPGARGADVVELLDTLVRNGVVGSGAVARDRAAKTYGMQTVAAVKRYQNQQGLTADGVAGADTLAALTMRIVVDRGTHTLTLYRNGAVVKRYGVAVGSEQYPTPSGNFRIQSKQKDPTWTPPDSAWAVGEKPIGPGADNPLGTRWMAVDGTVGIHGTNNPASIGYSVSHGCIRMRIPDVEDLFDRVQVGTRVDIV